MRKSQTSKLRALGQWLLLHYMRSYLRLALFFYYKNIKINYEVPLRPDVARLLLGNHHNGLMDPLLIATKSGQFSYFLTRASVFKREWISRFLKSMHMIPVYRVRDGWDQLSKNEAVFKSCSQLLHQQKTIVLFPEGIHNIKRYVRPLSKGFTRIISDHHKRYPNEPVEIVPVGFNYENAEAFGDTVVLNFGAPLYKDAYQHLAPNEFVTAIKKDVHQALTTLSTHIDSSDYERQLAVLENKRVDFLDPKTVNGYLLNGFPDQAPRLDVKKLKIIKAIAKMGLCVLLFLPYGIWKLWIRTQIKEPEFTATFRFAVVISLVPIFMILVAVLLWLSFNIYYALLYLALVFILDVIAVKL